MFSRKTPGDRGERSSSWSVESLSGGGVIQGWLAGDPVWVWTHWMGRSLPCHRLISDGALSPCPYCERRSRTSLIGYVPMYEMSGRPIVVVTPECHSDALGRLQWCEPVKAVRAKVRGSGIAVLPDRGRARYVPTLPSRQGPADIRPWLLRLWGDEVVRAWCLEREQEQRRSEPDALVPVPSLPVPDPEDEGQRRLQALIDRHRARASDSPPSLGEAIPPPAELGRPATAPALRRRRRKAGE